MKWVTENIRGGPGLEGIWALVCLRLNTRWARVSSVADAGLEDLEDIMVCKC